MPTDPGAGSQAPLEDYVFGPLAHRVGRHPGELNRTWGTVDGHRL